MNFFHCEEHNKSGYSPGISKRRRPKCTQCAAHGIDIPSLGHKRECPFRKCSCNRCWVIKSRRGFIAEQMKLRRRHARSAPPQINGDTNVAETVTNHKSEETGPDAKSDKERKTVSCGQVTKISQVEKPDQKSSQSRLFLGECYQGESEYQYQMYTSLRPSPKF